MNNPSTRIVAAITLLLCGWILGFLRIPYIDITQSFFIGFIAGLFLLGLFLLTAQKQTGSLIAFLLSYFLSF